MSLTIGWEDNTEEWWWGVIWILFSVGVLKIVPAASNRGVCFGTLCKNVTNMTDKNLHYCVTSYIYSLC